MSDTTEEFCLGDQPVHWENSLVLRLIVAGQVTQERIVESAQLTLGGPGSDWLVDQNAAASQWRFVNQDGRLYFVAASRKFAVRHLPSDSKVHYLELAPGDLLEFADFSIQIASWSAPIAFLESHGASQPGVRWPLQVGQTQMGRTPEAGGIVLIDKSVSRLHAKLHVQHDQIEIEACSLKSETRVNSSTLTAGQKVPLAHGDLVWLGRQLLRLNVVNSQEAVFGEKSVVSVYSLGHLRVFIADQEIGERQWQGPLVKYLLALLCLHRKNWLSEERLFRELWNEEDVSKKRLHNMISIVRNLLKSTHCPDPIQKTQRGYQLNPNLELWHDLEELGKLTASVGIQARDSRQIEQLVDLAQHLLNLYTGRYLEGCILPFAEIKRAEVAIETINCLCSIGQTLLRAGQYALSGRLALRIVEHDRLNGSAHLLLLESLSGAGKHQDVLVYYSMAKQCLETAGQSTSSRMDGLCSQAKQALSSH